ncbi:NAD(P)H-dependent oxidoreductase [Curtobacterium flaccumfaciens]|nr:NAD(P)H-dependent oxidoreductase [Curtobacterium flaccumfaciens]
MSGELVVGVSGSPSDPSRTSTLVAATVARLAEEIDGARTETIEIGPLLADLGAASGRETMSDRTRRALETVESADVLVVGSPAFRAAYSGAFKLFFDWVGQYDLVDTPVLLTATGGSDRHALLVEHQMRPLFWVLPVHDPAARGVRQRAGLHQARGWLRHRERRPRAPHRPGRAPRRTADPWRLRHRRPHRRAASRRLLIRARAPCPSGRTRCFRVSLVGSSHQGRPEPPGIARAIGRNGRDPA